MRECVTDACGTESFLDATYKRVRKSKELLDNPKKRKKLESLLVQLEKLIASEG